MPPIFQPLPTRAHLSGVDPGLLNAVASGEARLTPAQGAQIFHQLPLQTLGRYADARARLLHGNHIRTYIIDRNINYTNICNARCTFCAFRRDADDHDAYTLEPEVIYHKISELIAIGGTQILMQGGMNPALPLEWYLKLLRGIKDRFPRLHIHAFSPPEFIEFVHFFNPPGSTLEEKIRWVMVRLRDAGLDSLPGGGGEIFAHHVRRKIGLGKCDADAWLTCMYVAHSLGMFTSATMMFGHIEGYADRIDHMDMVRKWQDRTLSTTDAQTPTGHYKAFISWPFQRENTPLGRVKDWGTNPAELAPSAEFPGDLVATFDPEMPTEEVIRRCPQFGRRVRMSSATDYLRTQALSRLYLDNFYSIGASWVTMGPHVGQVALAYGATDMGSVMMEENVVSSAGTTYCLDEPVICRLIREAGFTPAQRNNTYDLIKVHSATSEAPDLAVTDWSKHRARRMHQQAPKVARASITVGATN